ncbi:MAG TPA: peptide deformylase [Nitrospiria bacterium]|nr:peptide deformylase [Nitrospiria bacterium]
MTTLRDGSRESRSSLMKRTIVEYPEAVLRQPARPVERVDAEVERLIDDMIETMYDAPGVGLAAPQIGVPLRVFVYDIGHAEGQRQPNVLINPVILERRGTQSDDEGCLSVPDYRVVVSRANWVKIQGMDRSRSVVTLEGEGLLARLFQHETDHLNGRLLIDRISSLKRNMFLRRYRKRLRSMHEHDQTCDHDHDELEKSAGAP